MFKKLQSTRIKSHLTKMVLSCGASIAATQNGNNIFQPAKLNALPTKCKPVSEWEH